MGGGERGDCWSRAGVFLCSERGPICITVQQPGFLPSTS